MYINNKKIFIKRYSSGELKLLKSDLDKYIVDNAVEILFDNSHSFFELLLILDYYKNNKVKVNLILEYLPYQRMDHKGTNEVDTLSNVINILSSLNIDTITVCEPHCDLKEYSNYKSISLVEKIWKKVRADYKFNEDDIIVLTDRGGLKRYHFIKDNIVYFNKVRDPQTGLIVKHDIIGNITNKKRAFILDDIISTGDTIINIIDYLVNIGIDEIVVVSGHIENNKYNKRISNHKNVLCIYSTNSLKKKNSKKVKLYDVKELIYEQRND